MRDVDRKVKVDYSDRLRLRAPVSSALRIRTGDTVGTVLLVFSMYAKEQLWWCLRLGQEKTVECLSCTSIL